MFFADHEKLIYTPVGSDRKFDPLAVERALRIASRNRYEKLVAAWGASVEDGGDVNAGDDLAVASAEAEAELARIARAAFGLPEFPDCTDAQALEWLLDYREWMAGKGTRGKPPRA